MNNRKIWGSLHPFYEDGAILGRKVANRAFIRALLEFDCFDEYHFFLPLPEDCSCLQNKLRDEFPVIYGQNRFAIRLRRELPSSVQNEKYHCFHLSDCFVGYTDLMCIRNAYSRVIFPITAPTHSLSYSEYGRGFLQHLWSGVTGRDAIIATSRAGEAVVSSMYASLRRDYALPETGFSSPVIRRIPLGVEAASMPAPEERKRLGETKRRELGIAPEAVVFLVFARISYHSKMDLLPLLRAFKRTQGMGLALDHCHLLLAGWVDDGDSFADDVLRFASNLGIKCTLSARPDDAGRKALYAAADVFVSPSDNLQETFGLTILEAAAASLPIIASDFDGYKDLVVPEITGILIPTTGPQSVWATNILSVLVPAGEYHLSLAQQCVVDVKALAGAIFRLASNADLRASMGVAAREHALVNYCWSGIIERYVALWDELAGFPLDDGQVKRIRSAVHPAHPDYTQVFGGYYSRSLKDEYTVGRVVRWSKTGEAIYRGRDFPVIYRLIDARVEPERLKELLFAARKPILLEELARKLADAGQGYPADGDFLLLWALKHDLLEFLE